MAIAGTSSGAYFNPGAQYGQSDMWIIKLTQESLAINYKTSSKAKVYPNPVKTMLCFEVENMDVLSAKVFDINGRLVLDTPASGAYLTGINREMLSSGVYAVTLFTSQDSKNFKVVKH